MNCDSLARWYRWLEYAGFGQALERRRREFLPRLIQARKVLVLGEGDGRFLAALLRSNRTVAVDYIDSSAEMLVLARRRARAAENLEDGAVPPRARFHHEDALRWLQGRRPGGYDAVCAHFFLDCFTTEQLKPLVGEVARHAAGNACWIVSEFRYPDRGLARWCGYALITALYGFFRVFTGLEAQRLPEHGPILEAAGFRRVRQVTAHGGTLESQLWERG